MYKDLSAEFDDLCDDSVELVRVVENLDNFQRKNNIKLRGLKEGVEGRDYEVF